MMTTYSTEIKYPIIHIPGMFDNGDFVTSESLLAKDCDAEDGFYYTNYFKDPYIYNKEPFVCSSSVVDTKYHRLIIANLLGEYRTDLRITLMSDRFFALMFGTAPRFKNYKRLTNYQGNDFAGSCIRDDKEIIFRGILEEVWSKYGKKVYYKITKQGNRVIIDDSQVKENTSFYINNEGYFDSPNDIKFNFIVHSSGGIVVRRYIELCQNNKLDPHINSIVNLSIPQKGARLVFALKGAFPKLIKEAIDNFWQYKDSKSITVDNKTFKYSDLIDLTSVRMLHGNSKKAIGFRKIIGNYILYFIPFDGKSCVLGTDPTIWDLHPKHNLIKRLKKVPIPDTVKIYNYRVIEPYALMFKKLGKFLELEKNDGVVDYRDTFLDDIPNYKKLEIVNFDVEKANHIPFPYIKAVYELRETIESYYSFLKILLKQKGTKEENITTLYALFKAIMTEFGLDLDYFLKNENYSVIDYFAENPVAF